MIVGTNSASYSDNRLGNNDVIVCNVVSNAVCLTNANVTSNQITLTVIAQLKPSIIGLKKSYCENDSSLLLSAIPSGGNFTVDGAFAVAFNPIIDGFG